MARLYLPDDTMREVTPANPAAGLSLEEMQAIVHGHIELVSLGWQHGVQLGLVIDEDGKGKGLDINLYATGLWRFMMGDVRDVIVGPALLVTITDSGTDTERWE